MNLKNTINSYELNISSKLADAIENNDITEFRKLINLPSIKNSDINLANSLKRKLFYYVNLFDNVEFLKELLLHKEMNGEKAINLIFAQRSPLMCIVAQGDLDFFKLILNHPRYKNIVDLNIQNEMRDTVFLVACKKSQIDIVEFLFNNKDSLKINIQHENMLGWNGLFSICQTDDIDDYQKYIKTIKYLLTNLIHSFNINKTDLQGWNVLMYACHNNNLNIVKYLLTSSELSEKANLYHISDNGLTPFKLALSTNSRELIDFFIMDLKINIDKDIIKWLEQRNENIDDLNNEEKEANLNTLNYIKSFLQYQKLGYDLFASKQKINLKNKI